MIRLRIDSDPFTRTVGCKFQDNLNNMLIIKDVAVLNKLYYKNMSYIKMSSRYI